MFLALGLSCIVPAAHLALIIGYHDSFPYLALFGASYILGAIVYATRVPESIWPGYFDTWVIIVILLLLLARLMGQYCFAGCRLSSSSSSVTLQASGAGRPPGAWKGGVETLPAVRPAGRRARGRSGGRHYTAGQSCYVPLGRHLVNNIESKYINEDDDDVIYFFCCFL